MPFARPRVHDFARGAEVCSRGVAVDRCRARERCYLRRAGRAVALLIPLFGYWWEVVARPFGS
eukprot:5599076-Pyramimonas_sp.AAC.1